MGGGLGAVVTFYLNTECSLVNVDGAAPTVHVVQHWNFGLKTLKSQQMLIVHIIVQKGILFNLVKKSIFFKSQTSNFQLVKIEKK
jgi:hypothetical protein